MNRCQKETTIKDFLSHSKIDAFRKLLERSTSDISDEEANALKMEISSSPILSLAYCMVMGKNFPEGENSISQYSWTAQKYATSILKGRFPMGENSICKSNEPMCRLSYRFYCDMLFKRDPIKAILEDAKNGGPVRDFKWKRRVKKNASNES